MELIEHVQGPQGAFVVSTIRLSRSTKGWPFSPADYADENPWPFETMVFKAAYETGTQHSVTGQYHEPYATEAEARAGHALVIALVASGRLSLGAGVRGDFGVPALTAEEWHKRVSAAKSPSPSARSTPETKEP